MSQERPSWRATRQHLIFDGDDTLWENNVYFEQAIEDFLDLLDHSTLSRAEVRLVLDEIERANVAALGYGSVSFTRSLHDSFARLAERDRTASDLERIEALGRRVLDHELELIAGVEATLADLVTRHDLFLFTKGQLDEQRLKVDRSGLVDYFRAVVVPPEKDVAAYQALIQDHHLDSARTWMIGNSPKSDINPALNAGLNAVFIPHDQTWRLEHQDLELAPPSRQLLVIEQFAQLRSYF